MSTITEIKKTVIETALANGHDNNPSLHFCKQENSWEFFTRKEVWERVKFVASLLEKSDVKQGDHVAIFADNSPWWFISNLAVLALGAVTVPIYTNTEKNNLVKILTNLECKTIFLEESKKELFLQVVQKTKVKNLFWIEKLPDKFEETDFDLNKVEVSPLSPAIIISTSGTTGQPKGAIHTHQSILKNIEFFLKTIPLLNSKIRYLSFLPLSHIFEQWVHLCLFLSGAEIFYAQSRETVKDDVKFAEPHIFCSVPRGYQKFKDGILKQVNDSSKLKQVIFYWALNVGKKWFAKKQKGEKFFPLLSLQRFIANLLVYKKLAKKMLGSNIQLLVSGGAAIDDELVEFFWALGFMFVQGFGSSEGGITFLNAGFKKNRTFDFSKFREGSVGRVIDNSILFQVVPDEDYADLAPDENTTVGEIIWKSQTITSGYWNNVEENSKTFKGDWYHTGDIGYSLDGFLFIVDRKKDIIVTSGGKNIAPVPIEDKLKTYDCISDACVIGDKRKYLTVLILQADANDGISAEIQKAIDEVNASLESFSQIKYFRIIDGFSENELTPTEKLRRTIIANNRKELINEMYSD